MTTSVAQEGGQIGIIGWHAEMPEDTRREFTQALGWVSVRFICHHSLPFHSRRVEFVQSTDPLGAVPRRVTIRRADQQREYNEHHRRFQAALKKVAPRSE